MIKKSRLKKTFHSFKKHFEYFSNKLLGNDLEKAYLELQDAYINLNKYKDLLEIRVEEEIEKYKLHEDILTQQSRLAAMGEMMDAVAHQWVQPLTVIDLRVNMMSFDYSSGIIDEKYIDETIKSVNLQKDHMLSTLQEFRNFFNPVSSNQLFNLNEMVEKTLLLMKDELIKNKINIRYEKKDNAVIDGSSNEIKHVLINLINNSKDAFNSNNIKKRTIEITVKEKPTYSSLSVKDSAGGISEEILEDIFKPYTTTKTTSGGSGIGLYMSTIIMQKHNGKIIAKNRTNGAKFTLKFYKKANT